MKTNIILQGNALEQLKKFPNESINCVMTSPPYWGQRDYGVKGQLGLEPTFQEYINNLCDVFDEVKRVLRDDGVIFVNIGDVYASGGEKANEQAYRRNKGIDTKSNPDTPPKSKLRTSLGKCLLSLPARFQIEMINRGWTLRNTIIWHKPNCLPESVKDRFTNDFEYIYFFSKNKKYYFEQQLDNIADSSIQRLSQDIENQEGSKRVNAGMKTNGNMKAVCSHKNLQNKGQQVQGMHMNRKFGNKDIKYLKKNKRAVWKICPRPYKEAHFAVFPEELCETPLKAGCPEGGIVLDPFFGSGTTGLVALKQNKKFIGIELNKEYIEIAKKRLQPFLEQKKLK